MERQLQKTSDCINRIEEVFLRACPDYEEYEKLCNERIHEQVKNSPNNYEVVGVKILQGYIFIEVREIIKNEND